MGQDSRESATELPSTRTTGWLPDPELKPEELARILGGITDGFVALDAGARFTYANEQACEILGRKPRELLGRHLWTEFPEAVGRDFNRAYERAFAEQRAIYVEDYYPPLDRWFENRIYPHAHGVSIIFRDVTERKRMEQLLKGQSAVLERISATAPLAESLDLLARTMDEQAPGNLSSILLVDSDGVHIHHAAGPKLPEAYNRAIEGATIGPGAGSCGTAAYRRERVFVCDIATDPLWKDIKHVALEHGLRACWSTPILGTDGSVLGTFAIYRKEPAAPRPHDLEVIAQATHLARIAIESDRARTALQRSHERFDLVIQSSDAGIWDVDVARKEVFLSPRWKSQLGYTDAELPNRRDSWESLLHPEDRERALAAGRDCLEGRVPTFEIEYRLRHKDGSYRWIVSRGIAIRDPSGRPLRMTGSHQDVTERKALEARFLQAQKMEGVGRLASGVAHDFNNVLSLITSYSELVLARLQPGDPLRDHVDEIRKAGAQGSSLTRQLLLFARRQVAEPRVLDLNEIVPEMEKMLRRVIGKDVAVEVALERPLGRVEADAGRVEQVILNLCVNARDAMPHGGKIAIGTANVDLPGNVRGLRGPVRPGRYVALSVHDTGSGMTPEVLARLFEPFFTTKEPGKGTGLGLSTVEAVVEAAGGCISVASVPGEGSTLAIYFPRVETLLSSDGTRTPCASRRT
jgi:PAS domain S-box-containing protein